jgi:hypothetical protein
LIQPLDQINPSLQQFIVRQVLLCPSIQYLVQPLSFSSSEFVIAEVGVVDNLRDALHPPVTDCELLAQRFERAILAPMTEPLGAKHVEGYGVGMSSGFGSKHEARLRVDEAANQPC